MEQVKLVEGEAAREEALASREAQVLARERDVDRREEAVRQLTRALDDGRARLAAEADRDWVLGEMREVNQHLVLTALGAQTIAEEATDARAAAEAAHRVIEVAQQAMLRADRRKDEFLAMLGHELRNPLAPLLTAVELMKLRPGEGCAREREVIERQVRHMMRLVDDLLDVTRITSGKVVLHRCVVELSAAVADAVELARPLVESRRHALTVAVPAAGLTVDVDPTRLAQVIANLLTNAAKYTEPGGAIAVEAAREGDHVRLAVTENGVGIPAELLPRVFDLFVQSSQTIERSRGGLGLGLAIVRNLVVAHGGEVTAESRGVGEGSRFVLRLPAAGPVSLVPEPPTPKGDHARGEGPARRVLVVDDNADAADMLVEALRSDARAVAIARDGLEALRAVTSFDPDVVLIDIGLPVMDGYELAARLREREAQRPSARRLRLIAVTGYGQEADRRRSKAAGMDAHLVKPVRLDDLEAMLNAGPAA
jgi:signal transduction histidine kinase/ActR/RegA family two-component response regulator